MFWMTEPYHKRRGGPCRVVGYYWQPTLGVLSAVLICTPIWLFKQLTNVIQLVDSMKEVAALDAAERARHT